MSNADYKPEPAFVTVWSFSLFYKHSSNPHLKNTKMEIIYSHGPLENT